MSSRLLFLAPASSIASIFPVLKEQGVELGMAENLKGAQTFIRRNAPSAIFARPYLPGFKVEELLAEAAQDPGFPPIIIIADSGSPAEAQRLLELGAKDYWVEPLDVERIMTLAREPRKPAPVPASSTLGGHRSKTGPTIVGSNPAIARVMRLARQVAPSRATVLITGESGTGKEMFVKGEEFVKPDNEEILKTIILHYNMLIDEKGEYTAIREMRKHVAWYVKGMKNATIIRNQINTYETYDECEKFLRKIFM